MALKISTIVIDLVHLMEANKYNLYTQLPFWLFYLICSTLLSEKFKIICKINKYIKFITITDKIEEDSCSAKLK